jgi:anti-sigma B factor antagonist
MELREKVIDDTCIIEVSGRLDTMTSKDLESRLNNQIEQDRGKIIVDLGGVDYTSSVGLRVLLAALKKQKEKQRTLKLASMQPFVKDIFRITGLDRIFSIYPTQEDAITDDDSRQN